VAVVVEGGSSSSSRSCNSTSGSTSNVCINYCKNSKYYKLCTMSDNCEGRGTGVVGNPLGAWHLRVNK